jgi:hypothetical protein
VRIYGRRCDRNFCECGGAFFECHDLHTLKHKALIEDVITRFCPEKHLNSGHKKAGWQPCLINGSTVKVLSTSKPLWRTNP